LLLVPLPLRRCAHWRLSREGVHKRDTSRPSVMADVLVADPHAASTLAETYGDIVIGIAGALSGDLREFDMQMRQGAQMAVADVKASGSVLGKALERETIDYACDPN